ncbi:flagellar assembly protein FliH [Chromatiaceae bacterium AAb-1]|nr:flagellar assembly protein FliH [Chromatiaceae bacterium AAb-1]
MTTDAFKYKRPFSPDADTEEQLHIWDTPDMTAEHPSFSGRTNALNLSRPLPRQEVTGNEDELTVKPLTAGDIEQMRQAAYDEGFAEGKEEGFSKGYSEGREQGHQDGLTQGQAEGRKQGLTEGQQEQEQKLAQLAALLQQLQQPLAGLDKQVEQSLLDLALAMAQAVIGVEVKTNPQVILQTIQEATAVLPLQAEHILIKLHPADLAIVEQYYPADEIARRGWQLQGEPALEQGGCLVESQHSSVDRSLRQRLQSSLDHFLSLHDASNGSD